MFSFTQKRIIYALLLGFFPCLVSINQALADDDLIREELKRWVYGGKTQTEIATDIDVNPSTISRFLDKSIRRSPKILRNFKMTYPKEYETLTTPKKTTAIKPRTLTKKVPRNTPPNSKVVRKLNFDEKTTPKKESPIKKEVKVDLNKGQKAHLKKVKHNVVLPLQMRSVKLETQTSTQESKTKIRTNSEISAFKESKYDATVEKQVILSTLSHKPSDIQRKTRTRNFLHPKEIHFKAPIVISYRDEGKGKGAYYDHYTIQKITKHNTLITHDLTMKIKDIQSYIKSVTSNLPLGVKKDGRNVPEVSVTSYEGGLLVIPGRIRANEFAPIRTSYERHIIKEGLRRGQPILAICAGSWQLWEAFGGQTCEVEDHCYGGGMIRISETTGRLAYNKQIHRISVEADSLLSKSMGKGFHGNPTVNSVHWKAPDESTLPDILRVSARALADKSLAPGRRTGERQMQVETDSIEAFESKFGTPIMGIQWHPEAYNADDSKDITPQKHRNLIRFMAQAGTAFYAKRKMLEEFAEVVQ